MKITFKKQPKETGLAAVGNPKQSVNIKSNGKIIGVINAPTWQTKDGKWSVSFTVLKNENDGNPNCVWKWMNAKQRFDTEESARQWVKDNIDLVAMKYMFYEME